LDWALLFLPMQRVLAKSRVVLHDLQALRSVALVLGRCVVVLSIYCAHNSNDFSGFRFLRHFWSSCAVETRAHTPDSLKIMTDVTGGLQAL